MSDRNAAEKSEDPILLVPFDRLWRTQFLEIGGRIRGAMGEIALRIDHIGSTSIPSRMAKPVIDIQISVRDLAPLNEIRNPPESLGYRWRPDNQDATKRYFREPKVYPESTFTSENSEVGSQQLSLLFRDYLRTHPRPRRPSPPPRRSKVHMLSESTIQVLIASLLLANLHNRETAVGTRFPVGADRDPHRSSVIDPSIPEYYIGAQ